MLVPSTPYISIPKGLATHLVKNDKELKAISFWYGLKSLRVGGYIKDFSKQAKDIAHYLGCSERTLWTYVGILKEMGYLERPNKQDISLKASRLLAEQYGVSTKKYYQVPLSEIPTLKYYITTLAYQENINRQEYAQKKKLENQYLSTRGIHYSSLQPAARHRYLRGFSVEKELAQATKHFEKQVSDYTSSRAIPAFNPHATLSRLGMAKARGKKDKSSGKYMVEILKELGYIEEQECQLDLGPITPQEMGLIRELGADYTFRCYKGRLVKSLSNLITTTLPKV
ncbi:hypothetical protein GCM10027422_07310 [Hymenobacter arcticus]